ncbi:MAG TPA: hypothetical protein EYQ58_01875 [Candidatus Poseidoniales archaeon]|nr:hypothetical protein [Candidatus Poseidoniales archaeon]
MVSELLLFQVATFSALIGMTLGWRGVMTKYSGFYDLPTAWSQIFWGIIVGMFYATWCDSELFIPYLEFVNNGDGAQIPHPLTLLILALLLSVAVHMLLRRDRVRKGGSHPTSGWALGLAIGGMTAMVLIFRYIFIADGVISAKMILTVAALAILTPRCEAMITAHQGFMMLNGRKWGAVLRSTAWRIALLTTIYYSIFDPFGWIFIGSMMMIMDPKIEDWIWASIPKPARRRLRRIWASNEREKRSKHALGEEE